MKPRHEKLFPAAAGAAWLLPLLLVLAGPRGAEAGCAKVDNPELVEYSCEGGSTEDLQQVSSNAEKIRISGMPVGRLGEAHLSRFHELLVLACSHCQISEIEDTAFRQLRNLQQLSLDNNQLKEVRAAWFEGLVYLTYLDLNYNSIERIDGDVFRRAPELVDLRLSGNRLLCLDLESLSRLRDLKRVFINENPGFGCPNALKRFLAARGVDYEADPQWASQAVDRVRASEPVQPAPAEERYPPPVPADPSRWSGEVDFESTPLPPPPPPTLGPRPAYPPPPLPEMIQPSAPEQEFPLQGPFYAPKVNQQQLDSYRNSLVQQAQNASEAARNRTLDALANATLPPNILVAGQQPPATTECPNAAGLPLAAGARAVLLGLAALGLAARGCC